MESGKIITAGITFSFFEFCNHFYNNESNILDSFLLNNPVIKKSNGFPYDFSTKFWTSGTINVFKLSRLRIRDFLENGKLKSNQQINIEFSLNIPVAVYFRIGTTLWYLKNRFDLSKKSVRLEQFFGGFKKGSKQCRKILNKAQNEHVPKLSAAFAQTCSLTINDDTPFSSSLGLWQLHSIPNDFREFIFKFFHNRLPTNTRVSNFSDNSRWCTFCSIVGRGLGPFDDETFPHLFINCPTVANIHRKIELDLLEVNPDQSGLRWVGLGDENIFLRLFILAVQYLVWCSKKKNCLPDANFCIGEAVYLLDQPCKFNKKIRNALNNTRSPVSRLWPRLTQPRW
jgi:hypothetical protein